MNEENSVARPGVLVASTARTFPAAITLTGTIVSVGTLVTGTGTLFTTEIAYGNANAIPLRYKFIYSATRNEIREISHVLSDTTLILKTAFGGNLGSQALTCPDYRYQYKEVSIACADTGGVVSTPDLIPVTMLQNSTINFRWIGGLDPIAVNGVASPLQVTTIL